MPSNDPAIELRSLQEAAELLAERYSMIGDLLREASATFASAIERKALQKCSDEVKEHLNSLADEFQAKGGVPAYVEKLESFEANTVIGRILDLGEEIRPLLEPNDE